MRPKDLFMEAASYVQPIPYDSSERMRLAELKRELKNRASSLLGRVFNEFGVDEPASSRVCARIPNVKDESKGVVWRGETTVYKMPEGSMSDQLDEVTRRWVALEAYAEDEFNQFAPEGFYVKERTLVGLHDTRYSFNGGKTWSGTDKATNLEVITGLFIAPDNESGRRRLEDGDVFDPFDDGPTILERINEHGGPVFSEHSVYDVPFPFNKVPEPYQYPNPQSLIEGIHSALDRFNEALRH